MNNRGFTLVEMALILLITAVLIGGGVMMTAPVTDGSRVKQTNDKIAAIEAALKVFRENYGRLPCPADPTLVTTNASFGLEYPTQGTCTGATGPSGAAVEGAVPTRILSLPDEFALDGWGNRFIYAVDRRFTVQQIFTDIPLNQTCTGQIQVWDKNGAVRTSSGISLVASMGPNGHGAHKSNGGAALLSAGSTNALEQENCDCNASATAGAYNAIYVQGETSQNPASSTDTFDDIVSYKTRSDYALDTDKIDYYDGPELVVGSYTGPRLTAYIKRCGEFLTTTSPTPQPTTEVLSLAFSPDNQFVASGNNAGTSLIIYQRSSTALTGIALAKQPSNQPARGVAFSPDNNYLAVATTKATAGTEPGMLTVYQRSGATFTPIGTTTSNFSSWAPGFSTTPQEAVAGYAVSWTHNSLYLALARDMGDHMSLYWKSGDYFTQLANPTTLPNAQASAVAYSPDSSFLAIATTGSAATPQVIVYQRSGTTYTALNTYTSTTSGSVPYIAWSPNKSYFAFSYGTSGLKLYKVVGTTFTDISANVTPAPSNPWGIAFSRDSLYLAVADGASASNVKIYRRSGDTFTGITSPPNAAGFARAIAFRN